MVLHILRAVQSKPIKRFSLNKSINEVSSFNRPPRRNFSPLNLNLLGENVLPNFATVSASVRTAAEHAFIADDAHGEVVDRDSVRLLAHDFGRHVAGSAGCILGVVWVPDSSDAQVCNFEVAIGVENQVFWLDISVEDTLLMKIFQRGKHTGDEESGLLFCELLVLCEVVAEIAALH